MVSRGNKCFPFSSPAIPTVKCPPGTFEKNNNCFKNLLAPIHIKPAPFINGCDNYLLKTQLYASKTNILEGDYVDFNVKQSGATQLVNTFFVQGVKVREGGYTLRHKFDKPGRIDVTVRLAGLVEKKLKCYKESTVIINVAPKAYKPNVGCPNGFKLVNGICQEQTISLTFNPA